MIDASTPSVEMVSSILYGMVEELELNMIDAVLEFRRKYDMEIEDVIQLLERPVIEDIRQTAVQERMVVKVEKTNSLLDLFA